MDTIHEISDVNLSGEVGGAEFEFVSGYAEEAEGVYYVALYSTEPFGDPCGFGARPSGDTGVLLALDPEKPDWGIGRSNGVQFVVPPDESEQDGVTIAVFARATDGRVILDDITEETVSGRMLAFDEDHFVDGTFTVPLCSD